MVRNSIRYSVRQILIKFKPKMWANIYTKSYNIHGKVFSALLSRYPVWHIPSVRGNMAHSPVWLYQGRMIKLLHNSVTEFLFPVLFLLFQEIDGRKTWKQSCVSEPSWVTDIMDFRRGVEFFFDTGALTGASGRLISDRCWVSGSRPQAPEARRRAHLLQPHLLGRAAQDQVRQHREDVWGTSEPRNTLFFRSSW